MAKKKVKKKTTRKTDHTAISSLPVLPVEALTPYKNNPRSHSDEQIARLVASLDEFGWIRPIIADEKLTVLVGHGMLEAAKARGDKAVPVIIKTGLSAKQKKAAVIADNKLTRS